MDGLVRRASGVYVARLAVPKRLRGVLRKVEYIASTGVRELAVAKIVAGQLIAQWRQEFRELDRAMLGSEMDVLTLMRGSPVLAAGGHLSLHGAAAAAGIGEDTILRGIADRHLSMFIRVAGMRGNRLPFRRLEREVGEWGTRYIAPNPGSMPEEAVAESFTGILWVLEPHLYAEAALVGSAHHAVMFAVPKGGPVVFVPDEVVELTRDKLLVSATDVEVFRKRLAGTVTAAQLGGAMSMREASARGAVEGHQRRIADSVEPFLSDHGRPRNAEQTARIRRACRMFLELMGTDLRGVDLSRELIRRFRDDVLPTVPAYENKLRLKHRTTSLADSIAVAETLTWPRMPPVQQVKQLGWVLGWFHWLSNEGWTQAGLADGLASSGSSGQEASKERMARRSQDRRNAFVDEELARIFESDWFKLGAGKLTKSGSYRTWMPYRTWLPLMGLLTGARLNELAQLHLADIRVSDGGVWMIDINDNPGAAGCTEVKKLKNAQSRRIVPVHPELVRVGLIEWRNRLEAAGHSRLFPELSFDEEKGFGKAVTKWFSAFMYDLGVPRDGKKVFHSFRHTVATRLSEREDIKTEIVSQLLGHERGESTTQTTYRKDSEVFNSDSPVVKAIRSLQFPCTAGVAKFDCDAGMSALRDSAVRKRSAGTRKPSM